MAQSVMQKLFQLLDWLGKLLAMGPDETAVLLRINCGQISDRARG
jgi:hypothetical protein